MIWQKALIMERERFDGADVAHVLRARADRLDWDRLLDRFAEHWPVLLSHLILFGYIYPEERAKIPARVMRTLLRRARESAATGCHRGGSGRSRMGRSATGRCSRGPSTSWTSSSGATRTLGWSRSAR